MVLDLCPNAARDAQAPSDALFFGAREFIAARPFLIEMFGGQAMQ